MSDQNDPLRHWPRYLVALALGAFLFTQVASSDRLTPFGQAAAASLGVIIVFIGAVFAIFEFTQTSFYRGVGLIGAFGLAAFYLIDIRSDYLANVPSIKDVEMSMLIDKVEPGKIYSRIFFDNQSKYVLTFKGVRATVSDDWFQDLSSREIGPGRKSQVNLSPDILINKTSVTITFAYAFKGQPEDIAEAQFNLTIPKVVGVPIFPSQCCETKKKLPTSAFEEEQSLLANNAGHLEINFFETYPNTGAFRDVEIRVPGKYFAFVPSKKQVIFGVQYKPVSQVMVQDFERTVDGHHNVVLAWNTTEKRHALVVDGQMTVYDEARYGPVPVEVPGGEVRVR